MSVLKMAAAFGAAGVLLGSMPVLPVSVQTVFAADQYEEGKCGDQVKWRMNKATGELVISGTGEMWNMLPEWDTGVQTAVIEEGITRIGENSFRSCSKLRSVKIADSVQSIGSKAFYLCSSLTDIDIPEHITDLGGDILLGTAWMDEKVKENPVVVLNNVVLNGKDCGEEAEIPEGVIAISKDAFKDNTNLKRVSLPLTLKSIGSAAFFYCKELEYAELPPNLTEIGASAFLGCSKLMFSAMPPELKSVDGDAFLHTAWLDTRRAADPLVISSGILVDAQTAKGDVVIPEGVRIICSNAFHENKDITSLVVPEGVEYIGGNAVQNCSALKWVKLPSTLKEIDYGVFWGCTALSEITIPEGVAKIGNSAFRGCTGLKEVTLPASLQEIRYSAFSNCLNLKTLTVLNLETVLPESKDLVGNTTVIEGYQDSTAQAYAQKYGLTFRSLGAAPSTDLLMGDVDGDGEVTILDAQMVLTAYAEQMMDGNGLTEAQAKAADIDRNGTYTAIDAQYIMAYFLYNVVLEDPCTWETLLGN